MEPIYKETCFISAGEANPEQELSLPDLMAKLIDIATTHANSLGIGNPSMTHLKAGWVLSRVTIDMTSYPPVNTQFCISTWIISFNRHFSERAFCISSPEGKIYGYARSIWMVMSTVDRSNVGLSQFHLPSELILGEDVPIDRQAKHGLILPMDSIETNTKGALISTHPTYTYRFKYCDLDSYRHVNTVRYLTLLLNQFSLEEFDKTFVKRLELSFLHEARFGMVTTLLRHDYSDGKSAFLLQEKTGQPLLYARIIRVDREIEKD